MTHLSSFIMHHSTSNFGWVSRIFARPNLDRMPRIFAPPTLLLTLFLSLPASADNWMSCLPDNVYVAALSIPGTHDSATGSGWADGWEDLGDSFARTQELTLQQQWDLGIRAFDLRPCCHEDHMNLNHGMVATQLHLEDVLRTMRDWLTANPSEFIIIHMLHETDGDQVENVYNKRILEVLNSSELDGLFINFRKTLKVADMRGHILLLSRDQYASKPVGGFFQNWTMEANWTKQMQLRIQGPTSNCSAIVQDYCETWQDGALQTKVNALTQLLEYSNKHPNKGSSNMRWYINMASGYSKVESLFGYTISSSDGYRDNAAHTHAAILDFLGSHEPGPTGIVMMDYAGVDTSGGYATRGREVVEAIIQNNFLYLEPDAVRSVTPDTGHTGRPAFRSLNGHAITSPRPGTVALQTLSDGTTRKILVK